MARQTTTRTNECDRRNRGLFGKTFLSWFVTWLALGCAGGCPEGQTPNSQKAWEAELEGKSVLPLRPGGELTIKRDVHYVVVDVSAKKFAAAFHQVMQDPERRFGLIRVNRVSSSAGKPFVVGEKFQGRYSLGDAAKEQLSGKWQRVFGTLTEESFVGEWICRIENGHTSDYGRIARLELDVPEGTPHVLQYEYLEGSPIAGSSTFVVRDVTDPTELARWGVTEAARLEQVFEYQEQTQSFAYFFTAGGLKLHNQVVWSQAEQSAQLSGAKILESDIPVEYRKL